MRGHPRWFKIRTRRVYKRSSRPDPTQTPLHSGSIMSLVDSSNNYNSNGQQPGYLASRHLMVQDLASRHPTLLKQLNSPPTICKCSGQSRWWPDYKHNKTKNLNYHQRSKTNKLILIFCRWPNCQCTSTSQLATSFSDKENQVPRGENTRHQWK